MVRPALRGAGLAGLRLLLRGDRHECPCCGSTFARFVPRDQSLLCPRCRSRERQRVLWLYLKNELAIETADARVLHFAPERSLHDRLKAIPSLRYETADLEPGELVDRTLDIQDLPYADDAFDLILCSHVLEHVPDDRRAARELARVLEPGGVALIQVPVDDRLEQTFEDAGITDPEMRKAIFGQSDHVRVYGTDVERRLDVTRIAYDQEQTPEARFRYLLTDTSERPGADIYRRTP